MGGHCPECPGGYREDVTIGRRWIPCPGCGHEAKIQRLTEQLAEARAGWVRSEDLYVDQVAALNVQLAQAKAREARLREGFLEARAQWGMDYLWAKWDLDAYLVP